jgi:hypothetical protein
MGEACNSHGEDKKYVLNFARKLEGKITLERPRHRYEDNVKMDIWRVIGLGQKPVVGFTKTE